MSKTRREVEIRDDLWKRVEALAARRNISADEVVQAALVQLFSRKKATTGTSAPNPATTTTKAPPKPGAAGGAPPRPAGPPPPRGGAGAPPPRPRPGGAPPARLPRPGASSRLPPPGGGARPPAPARAPAAPPAAAAAPVAGAPPLYMWCEGQWYVIDQEQFVIGRGAKYSDLAIKDANISRKHCAIVRRNGGYFIKDLGSTNGVEFHGERVDNHRVEEGYVYHLCDHELRFTFQPPQ